jgi:hypothetical protein
MDKKLILKKLLELFDIKELKDGFSSQEAAISWSNKVAPLLKLIDPQYYINFIQNSHKLNLNLSSYSLIPALNIMTSQMEMAIEELKIRIAIEEGLPDEMYFSENSYLDIQKNVARIIRQSKILLRICDGYMDEKIIEELTQVNAQEIRLLTTKQKGIFRQRLEAARKQFPSKRIEARESDKFHDRYYIIDQDQVWSLGASYNKAGQKATLLGKIKSNPEKDKIISDFEKWWLSSTPI